MSARRASATNFLPNKVTIQGRQARLTLSEDAVVIYRGGIEFRSPSPFATWTEMTLTLHTRAKGTVNFNAVVISCTGNKHVGYHVTIVFTSLSKQAQARLSALSQTPLA